MKTRPGCSPEVLERAGKGFVGSVTIFHLDTPERLLSLN